MQRLFHRQVIHDNYAENTAKGVLGPGGLECDGADKQRTACTLKT